MWELFLSGGLMALLGLSLALALAIAGKRLFVYEDPRIDDVESMLPQTNCGACGSPGCRAFAEDTVAGTVAPGKCTVSSSQQVEAIAKFLGVDAGAEEKRVARLACAGGSHVARMRARYRSLQTCRGAHLVSGGGKGCAWGCLGLADCMVVCDFDAIRMDANGLPVVDPENCTACNACVEVCPKDLFSLEPLRHRLWVACKNLLNGDEAEAECEVACTACARCAADAPDGVISMVDNLAVVDYEKNGLATRVPIERCPTGAIVWWDGEKVPLKGSEARKVLRKSPLPIPPWQKKFAVSAALPISGNES